MNDYIYVVSEELHGDVSWFDSKEKAIEEIKKLAKEIYNDLTIAEITIDKYDDINLILVDKTGDEYVNMIYARREKINKSFLD